MWGLRHRGATHHPMGADAKCVSPLRRRGKPKFNKWGVSLLQYISPLIVPLILVAFATLAFWIEADALIGMQTRRTTSKSKHFFPRSVTYTPPRKWTVSLVETTANETESSPHKNHRKRMKIRYPMVKDTYFDYLLNSKDFRRGQADPLETEDCEPQYDWQKASFLTCNSLHELDMATLVDPQQEERVKLIANGCEYI
jgi:hypothetical protein